MSLSPVQSQAYIVSIEGPPQGVLNMSDRSPHVNRQNFRPLQTIFLKGLLGFSAVNLTIAGSIIGYAVSSSETGMVGWSMPFFANTMVGLFGLIIARNIQDAVQEESTPLLAP